MNIYKVSKGMSIFEILVASAIILIITTFVFEAWNTFIKISKVSTEKNYAFMLLNEASEALLFIRDESYREW